MNRLIRNEYLPETLWRQGDRVLILPPDLIRVWLALLDRHNLRALANTPADALNRFAIWDQGRALMKSEDQFIRELACLHGVDKGRRHVSMLDSAFDRDEQLAFDAITQLQPSSYF